jgi:hypothetical protein
MMCLPLASAASTGYLYEYARINAMSLLVTNVTPELTRGGDVYGRTFPINVLWDQFSISAIQANAGSVKYGYRGPFESGCYTWMEVPDAFAHRFRCYNAFTNRTAEPANTLGIDFGARARCAREHASDCHVVFWNAPITTLGTASSVASRIQLRVDWHQEFISSDQLVVLSVTPYKLEDLSNATKTLALSPCFTENWTHLSDLWNSIKKIGSSVVKAGGRAAASAAVAEMAAGLPLLL